MKSDYIEIYGNDIPASLADYSKDIIRLQSAYSASLNLCNADSEIESVKRLAIKIIQNEILNQAIEHVVEDSYIVDEDDAIDCLIVIFPELFGVLPVSKDLEHEVEECSSLFDVLYKCDGGVRLNKELEHVLPKVIVLTESLDDPTITYEVCDDGEGRDFEELEYEKESVFDSCLPVNKIANPRQSPSTDIIEDIKRSKSIQEFDDLDSERIRFGVLGAVLLSGVGYFILFMYWYYLS